MGWRKPVTVFRKVEFAGPTGDGASMLDCVQEFTVFERLQETGANPGYFRSTPCKVLHQVVQTTAIHARMALKALQRIDLVVQFVERFTANIAARQDCKNLEQRCEGGPSRPVVVFLAISEHREVQELKPQKRPHTLRQGLFIVRDARSRLSRDFSSRFDHSSYFAPPSGGWQMGEPLG